MPAVVLHALDAAEADPGAPHRFPPGHSGANQIFDTGVEMEAHFLVEPILEAFAAGPGGQERAQAREHGVVRRKRYLWRSADIGSMRDARYAGARPAATATAASVAPAAATAPGVRPSIP